MKNSNALVVMAKAPDRAQVKTRLSGCLTEGQRLGLYTRLLQSTVKRLRNTPGADVFVNFTPPEGREYFEGFGLPLFPQPEGDLGARMYAALEHVILLGYQKAVLVGVDIPGLDAEVVGSAFSLLEESEVVFGPAIDGGYYLVGMKTPVREVFEGVQWSSESTLRQSIERTVRLGLNTAFTVTLSDVDTPEDLKRFPRPL